MSSLNSAWTTELLFCNPDIQGPTSSALTQKRENLFSKRSRLAGWQRWDLAGTVSSPGIPILKTEAGSWIASCVIRNSSVSRRQLSPEVLSVSSSPSLYTFLLAHCCPSLCTLSKMRAFCMIHQPMPAASLCKWLPAMDLYYFTKKHHRRNLFCTTEDMIFILSAALAQCFVCSLERNREERVSLH